MVVAGFLHVGNTPEGFKEHRKKSEQEYKPWHKRGG
jgi:hypothetical protein